MGKYKFRRGYSYGMVLSEKDGTICAFLHQRTQHNTAEGDIDSGPGPGLIKSYYSRSYDRFGQKSPGEEE
ncbi:MAG: hypothetical protein ACI8XM_001965 [Haloarculaceae archaeon]|jgi:hypothetical protein